MEILNVAAAALASFAFGAAWYMALAKPWMAAAGIECDENGAPMNRANPVPYILSALCMLVVAGMMRHIFAMAGITAVGGFGGGLISGFGIGACFIAPWVMINNAYVGRPFTLTLIDGGYAIFGCGLIGAVLTLL